MKYLLPGLIMVNMIIYSIAGYLHQKPWMMTLSMIIGLLYLAATSRRRKV